MKKVILISAMIIILMSQGFSQGWIKGTNSLSLYSAGDKVGIGTLPGSEKLTIKSLSGETPLALIGYGTSTAPILKYMLPNGSTIFRLYAKNNWWVIGNLLDSTTASLSVKPNWIRMNATLTATKVSTHALVIPPGSQPTGVIGQFYFSSADSCFYYYTGRAWKKVTSQ